MGGKNRGGSARDILSRGSRQMQGAPPLEGGETSPARPSAAPPPNTAATRGSAKKHGGTKRITVDLPREEHKFLRDFAYDNDTDGMRVVRALLSELRDDEDLAEHVLDRLSGQ